MPRLSVGSIQLTRIFHRPSWYPSYQLNIPLPHQFFHLTPPQDPNVSSLQLNVFVHDSFDVAVPQHSAEDCSVFVGSVDHADAAACIVKFLEVCGKEGEEGAVVVGGEEGLVRREVLRFER